MYSLRNVPPNRPEARRDSHPAAGLRVISWNLLRLVGAGVEDVVRLIGRHHPDILLMQEATADIAALPGLAGGHLYREPMDRRVYGLAVWSREPIPRPEILKLPVSKMPGRVPPRLAQLVHVRGITLVNVHLSHGQFLNRRQLFRIVQALKGPAAIVGDYNAVGPIRMRGFRDIGPREPTHMADNIVAFRLDRCMARGLHCAAPQVLARGPSDHHPIILDLAVAHTDEHAFATERRNIAGWVRALSQQPNTIRVPQVLSEIRRLRQDRRRAAGREHSA